MNSAEALPRLARLLIESRQPDSDSFAELADSPAQFADWSGKSLEPKKKQDKDENHGHFRSAKKHRENWAIDQNALHPNLQTRCCHGCPPDLDSSHFGAVVTLPCTAS